MSKKIILAGLILTMLFWAINFHFTQIALAHYSPMGVATYRFLFGVIILVLVIMVQQKKINFSIGFSLKDWWYVSLTSFFGIFLTIYFFNKGLMTTSAINSSLIIATSPAITALFSLVLMNKKIGSLQWMAILLSFLGVAIILVNGDFSQLNQFRVGSGDFYILLMATVFSFSQIIVSKYLAHVDAILLTTVSSVLAFILFVFSAFPELNANAIPSDLSFWGSVLFMGVLGTGFGYVAFYYSVVKLGASKSTLYLNLIPFFVVLLAFPFGEPIFVAQMIGGAIIILGLLLFEFAKNKELKAA